VATRNPDDYIIEAGPMGAIGEAGSLMFRVSRNCPWNRCLFCPAYKDRPFSRRSVKELMGEINAIKRISELIKSTSFKIGLSGYVSHEVLLHVIRENPDIYMSQSPYGQTKNRDAMVSLNNVANWMFHGGKRVFLQDANALAMSPGGLTDVLQYLKENFKSIETITCYARSRTCSRRTEEELEALNGAGLSWCFIGIESGCDDVLAYMNKGVKRSDHLKGCITLMAAGIHVAAFIMPGLAGGDEKRSGKHIRETITLLNEMKPTEIRIRSLAILEASPLYGLYGSGRFKPATEDQMIDEIRELLEGLDFHCAIETYQMTNVLFNVKGPLREKREELVWKIKDYQQLDSKERARLRLSRYLHGGYVDFLKRAGRYDSTLDGMITDAMNSLESDSTNALEKVEETIFAIKSRGVP